MKVTAKISSSSRAKMMKRISDFPSFNGPAELLYTSLIICEKPDFLTVISRVAMPLNPVCKVPLVDRQKHA